MLNIEHDDKIYTVVNIYCPTNQQERPACLYESLKWISKYKNNIGNLIVGGDVNCVDWPLDRSSFVTDKSSDALRKLKSSLDIIDVWKFMNPGSIDYTYIDPSYRNMNSRIDLLCACKDLLPFVESCHHKLTPCPDHKAVIMCLQCDDKKRSSGYWKLNTSVLKEERYRESVRNIIQNTIAEYMHQVNKSMTWELVKIRIKEFSIRYCCLRTKKELNKIRMLEERISVIDQALQSQNHNEEIVNERKSLKEQLDALFLDLVIGAQIRSKVKFVEQGEKSTSYFLAVENHRQNNNNIKALTVNDITYSSDCDILKIASNYYAELFSSKNPNKDNVNDYLENVNLPPLKPESQDLCEGLISLPECENAVNWMKLNNSPGVDGLPIEFYRVFCAEIGNFLVEMYNECFENNMLPASMRKSLVTLIHKKDDKTKIDNYRPISLTNTDYRILAFILANRRQNVIKDIVGPDQIAYIKNRFIGTNICLVQDLFNLYNEKNLLGLFVFVDFKKAFDSIECDFVFKTLNKFNFGQEFQQWIKLLYVKPIASVKNNGYFSEEFEVSRGVRQGCPVSSLLFVLCMEALANSVRQNVDIKV